MKDQLLDENFEKSPTHWNPTQDEKTLALVSHLGVLAGFIIPFGNIILPLILWQTQKDKSEYVSYHSKESLNFQITMMIGYIVSAILIFVFIGIFLMFALAIVSLVFTIIAAIKANEGIAYEYPFNLRLIK